MAWVDDRIWCHPKFSDITDRAFRVWVSSVAYSTGFSTRGVLTPGQQKQIGSDARTRTQLIAAGLWDDHDTDGSIRIHDWDDHNGRRDDRRVKERERLRAHRAKERETRNGTQYERATERSTDDGTERSTDATPTRVDGSDGSDGSDRKTYPRAVNALQPATPPQPERNGPRIDIKDTIARSLKEAS